MSSPETSIGTSLRRNWFWLVALAAAAGHGGGLDRIRERGAAVSSRARRSNSTGAATTWNILNRSDSLLLKAAVKARISFDHGSLLDAVHGRLTIRREADGRLIRIVSTGSNPAEAASLASAVVDAFRDEVEARNTAASDERTANLDKLHAQLEETEVQLLNFETGNDKTSAAADRKERLDTLTEQMATLGDSYDKLLHQCVRSPNKGPHRRSGAGSHGADQRQSGA